MSYSLTRDRDGAGDSGGMSLGIVPVYEDDGRKEIKDIIYENDCRPRVGIAMRVGSLFARSYSSQDWWQTTLITEILEEKENYVKFRTTNSIYEWKCS